MNEWSWEFEHTTEFLAHDSIKATHMKDVTGGDGRWGLWGV